MQGLEDKLLERYRFDRIMMSRAMQEERERHEYEALLIDPPYQLMHNATAAAKSLAYTFESENVKQLETCMICKLKIKQPSEQEICPECEHMFHRAHLQEWLKVKGTCPVCKRKIVITSESEMVQVSREQMKAEIESAKNHTGYFYRPEPEREVEYAGVATEQVEVEEERHETGFDRLMARHRRSNSYIDTDLTDRQQAIIGVPERRPEFSRTGHEADNVYGRVPPRPIPLDRFGEHSETGFDRLMARSRRGNTYINTDYGMINTYTDNDYIRMLSNVAMTDEEIARRLGLSLSTVRLRLKNLVELGRLEVRSPPRSRVRFYGATGR